MSNDDHDRLIRVAANWYGLYNELFVKAQRLTDENARARALISWIDGMCVDEADHMEIRAAIDRYWKSAGVVLGGVNPETELTGENLGDSGMGEPGGVSDGPQ